MKPAMFRVPTYCLQTMCNLYGTVDRQTLRTQFFADPGDREWDAQVAPLGTGVFLKGLGVAAVGQWGMIPAQSPTRIPRLASGQRMSTNNARRERVATAPTFRAAWARGQRCVIPAESFFEPNWESGKHIPWRFRRADGELLGLAGLWNTWTDKASGEVHESYTMLTLNADHHPLMNRMHRPDPMRPPNMQDKRSVVPITPEDVDAWLTAPPEQAAQLVRLAPAAEFLAAPAG